MSLRKGFGLRGQSKNPKPHIPPLAAIVANVISLAAARVITADILRLYLIGLPAMLAGLWVGFKLYGKLDDAAFRKLILVLLLVGGLGLILPRVV